MLKFLFNKAASTHLQFYYKEFTAQVFCREYFDPFKITYFEKQLRAAASEITCLKLRRAGRSSCYLRICLILLLLSVVLFINAAWILSRIFLKIFRWKFFDNFFL